MDRRNPSNSGFAENPLKRDVISPSTAPEAPQRAGFFGHCQRERLVRYSDQHPAAQQRNLARCRIVGEYGAAFAREARFERSGSFVESRMDHPTVGATGFLTGPAMLFQANCMQTCAGQ